MKYRHHLKRWVSTVSIFATHFQTISIVGNLHLHWPPPVEAVTGIATLSVFENTEMFRPECLVESKDVSTFYLFSLLISCGIAGVLLGSALLANLLYLARKLVGDPNLHFVEAPALQPPEVQVDMAQQKQYEAELAQAAAMPLPDGDGDEDLLD